MAKDQKQTQANLEEESLKDLILQIRGWLIYLWIKKWIILIAILLGSTIGIIVALTTEDMYSAKVTFVLEENKNSPSGLSGLAAMAGINMGSGGGLFEGDNILDLYQSRRMLTQTLLSPLSSDDPSFLLIDSYIDMIKVDDEEKSEKLSRIDFHLAPEQFTRTQDSVLGRVVKDIRKDMLSVSKAEKGRGQIQVETKSYKERFSKAFTETLVQNVSNFYIETRTKKSKENINVLQFQVDSVRKELNEAIKDVAISTDFNINPARQNLRVGSSQRQVDVQANEAILKELVKNLELAKVSFRKESPLIQVIDSPILPLDRDRFTTKKGIILGGIIAGFLIIVSLVGIKFYQDIMGDE